MKNNLLKNVLDWMLATSLLLSIWLFVKYSMQAREFRATQNTLQVEMSAYQNNHGVLNMIFKDSEEYAKTHSDLNRILDTLRGDKAATPK